MPRVYMDDVVKIWYRTPANSWYSLLNTLRDNYYDENISISFDTMRRLIEITRQMYYSNAPFPETPEQLHRFFNEN